MLPPSLPANESCRVAALHALDLLDTGAEERFDRLTRVAQRHFNVPIALVSLIDTDRQWFKSKQGLQAPETPRDVSFCGHAILGDEVFYIPDALADPRFADNPLVTSPPHVRFYAGAPLADSNGMKVGTLCIIDHQARTLSAEQLQTLRDLADCVEVELGYAHLFAAAISARSQEARLRAVLDTVAEGIITISEHGVIETFNPAAAKIFGYAADEVIGKNVKMLMPEPCHGEHDSDIERFIRTREPRIIGSGREMAGRRKDGSTFPAELAVSEMKVEDATMFTGVVRDLTEKKRIDRMKIEFVSTVSHELRTPLTSISGALGLIANGVMGELPEQARPLIEIARRNSQSLAHLIDDLLDMEKIAAGKMTFSLRPHPLLPLVEQALEACHGYAGHYGVRYVLTGRADGAVVMADSQRLTQILANFLSNAAKFSPRDSVVEVAAKRRDGRVRVEVRDVGPGIPAEFRPRIFQKFSQADSSDTRTTGGTGLGLAISRALAEGMGGVVGFESEEGKGSTFYVELPEILPP